jgi:hypothetical protein
MAQTFFVPTINDSPSDFCQMFNLYNSIIHADSPIVLDFSRCNFLRPNAVAFLGGLAHTMQSRSKTLDFDWSTLHDDIQANLAQNGFLNHIGGFTTPWAGNSIPYREDKELNSDSIVYYLKTKWLQRGWINISPLLADTITTNLVEIYLNAFEHSKSERVFTCGQYFPQLDQLILCVADFGVGIPYNVREFVKRTKTGYDIKSDYALRWAFEPGTTTVGGMGRGMGLGILKNFIKVNEGNLSLFSHNAYVTIDKDAEKYMTHDCSFHGTIMHITLQCDETLYTLPEELSQKKMF